MRCRKTEPPKLQRYRHRPCHWTSRRRCTLAMVAALSCGPMNLGFTCSRALLALGPIGGLRNRWQVDRGSRRRCFLHRDDGQHPCGVTAAVAASPESTKVGDGPNTEAGRKPALVIASAAWQSLPARVSRKTEPPSTPAVCCSRLGRNIGGQHDVAAVISISIPAFTGICNRYSTMLQPEHRRATRASHRAAERAGTRLA